MNKNHNKIKKLHIDIETFNDIDLTKCGVYRYVESSNFTILLFSYSIDDQPVKTIDLANGEEIPEDILNALQDESVEKFAFNANFERICLSKFLNFPTGTYLNPKSWYCTQAWAAALSLPASLKEIGTLLNLQKQKLEEGKSCIDFFTKPCKPTAKNGKRTRNLPHHAPALWLFFKEYNARDVETELELHSKLKKFPIMDRLWKEYWLDQKINDRGVEIDSELVNNALKINEISRNELIEKMKKITKLENPNSVKQLKEWLNDNGITTDSLDKKAVEEFILTAPQNVKEVLLLHQEISKSSVKKYQAMKESVCADGRARGMFKFYGANRTGRWSSSNIQLQNLPKNTLNNLETARELVKSEDIESIKENYTNVQSTLSQLVRTAFIPKENTKFMVLDFSAIEARILAWLAKETWRLNAFSQNPDIYCASASQMFNCPVEKNGINGHLRQKGKIAELALGYGGSTGALIAMGAIDMGLNEDELPELVESWRLANENITKLWWEIGKKAIKAIKYGEETYVNSITFSYQNGMLFISLPSGRRLTYAKPQLVINEYGKEEILFEGITPEKKWGKISTYGPKLVENIVQGISRDILTHAMLNLQNCNIVMHVHDEIVLEAAPEVSLQELSKTMCETPDWAKGLLLNAEGFITDYYKKD